MALLLATASAGLAAEANELGRPLLRDFAPGANRLAYLCQALFQDRAGYIYLANGGYLRVFDGAGWGMIKVPIESAGIRDFVQTADGTVFAAGAGVIGYLRGAGETAEFVSLAEKLPPSDSGLAEIFDVLAVGSTVYFADEEKILIWSGDRFTTVPCRSPPYSRGVRLHAVNGTVYVSGRERPLSRLVGNRLEVVVDAPELAADPVVLLERADGGALNALTADGRFHTIAGGRVQPLPRTSDRWLAGKKILKALRLSDGSLAVAFTAPSGGGGLRFDPHGGYVGPIDRSLGLWTSAIRDLSEDAEGGLWLGSEVGLFRLEWPSAVTLFDAVNGLGSGGVTDVVRHEGVLYAATSEGVFRLLPSDASGRIARFERLLSQPASALVSHSGGLLALGYAQVFAQGATGFVAVAGVPPGGGVLRQSRRDPARVWVGTTKGLQSLRHGPAGWVDEGPRAGFEENVRGVAETADGSLLVASFERGLFRVESEQDPSAAGRTARAEPLAIRHGLPARFNQVNLAEWGGEIVALFNLSDRPFRYDASARRFVAMAGPKALPANATGDAWTASDTDAGQADARWLAGAGGIYQVDREGAPLRRLPQFIEWAAGSIAGLREEGTGANRVLWICGTKGMLRVEAAQAFRGPVPYATVLTSLDVRDGAELRRDHGTLNFSYVALRHGTGNAVTYQTRLVGREANWSAWSPKREISFSNLGAGSYRFEVRARDAAGELSTTASLAFGVRPPWWLTGWAWLGYVAAGSGLIAGVVRFRTRALRRRAEQLEALVARRTREVAERSDELSRKNVELTRLHRLELDARISAGLAEEKARLEVLRYQLNPHFLFNALATISGLAVRQPSAARSVARQLAEFCRLTLTRGRHEFVTLEEEFQMLGAYLEVVRSGAEHPPEVTFTLDPAMREEKIPAFLLLPLVENASKYGRRPATGSLQIAVSARREAGDATLVIEVANTGTWVPDFADHGTTPSTRIGLDNIRQRLARIYPGAHTFAIKVDDGWVRAGLRLTGAPAGSAQT